jgi:ankyrin repeat protein
MLEAGGDPNARDEFGQPIILMNWYLGYYKNDARARLDLLLDRGADINATMNESSWEFAGYTLLLYRTELGSRYREPSAYADAVHLLERGADPNRTAADGMTFAKMLMEHRQHFTAGKVLPPEFKALWEWAQTHGILRQPE